MCCLFFVSLSVRFESLKLTMKIIKNAIIWIASILLGAISNSLILQFGLALIPPPPGANFNTPEGLAASMPLLGPENFIAPFAAHAVGTLVSAVLLTWLLKSNSKNPALIAGLIFFAGGLYMVLILPSPLWFNLLDLSLAYFPMGLLGYWIGRKIMAKTGKPLQNDSTD
jgi:hypothetical protein